MGSGKSGLYHGTYGSGSLAKNLTEEFKKDYDLRNGRCESSDKSKKEDSEIRNITSREPVITSKGSPAVGISISKSSGNCGGHISDGLLDASSIEQLQSMIGKRFSSIRTDVDKLDELAWVVECCLDDQSFIVLSCIDVADYYGASEDIPALRVQEGQYKWDKPVLVPYPIGKVITRITLVNYHIHCNNPATDDSAYMYSFTKGIIFDFDDGSQLSFERLDNFSELIVINTGWNLEDGLEPISAYLSTSGFSLKEEESFVEIVHL